MKMLCGRLFLMFFILFALLACEDEMDKHYKRPDWLLGSAYEVLEARGGYSMFLQAVDRGGFRTIVDGQGLCTVFAPTDEQFSAYLQQNGWSNLESVPLDALKTLVGFHIIQYSYKPSELINFQPGGVLNPEENPIYYKQKTYGKDAVYQIRDINGELKNIYKQEKYLSVFGNELFSYKKLSDYQYNYKYFYPNSEWKGNNDIYVANAHVLEDGNGIPTDNGYLYLINEVLKPARNIYDILEDNTDKYSSFQSMYDRFQKITYNANFTERYSNTGDSLFMYYHDDLVPKIASEWTFNYENGFAENLSVATGRSFNAFVPNNQAVQDFFTSYFPGKEVDEISLLANYYFLVTHVKASEIVFPEEIKDGRVYSLYGDVVEFNVDGAPVREVCTNGVFYGSDKIIVPAPFKTVTSPVFNTDEYTLFMYLLEYVGEILQLTNPDVEYTLFIPSDEVFEGMGYRLNVGVENVLGDETIQKIDIETGDYNNLSVLELTQLAAMHIIPQKITDFTTQNLYPAKENLTYIKVFDGGVGGEVEVSNAIEVTKIGDYSNGIAYEVSGLISKTEESMTEVLVTSSYSAFWSLMQQAGLWEEINGKVTIPMITGETMMVFIPTNEAIAAATNIPTDKDELADFLKYFFVSMERNNVSSYLLPGPNEIGEEGEYSTLVVDKDLSNPFETIYKKINLNKNINDFSLRLTNNTGSKQANTLSGEFPRFTTDGIIYRISTTDIQPE